ncbi:MAG: primosomal protein N' [Clostridia bacterium]|jgi:primosomal protein N' (replication factor Y)|nr:primosomal protein N' [Clostridia bacterium]
MFAKILILKKDSNYDQILTYLAPDHQQVGPGALVVVPVRGALQEGLILALEAEKPEFKAIKPIQKVQEKRPFLSSAVLQLAEWLAAYYLCSLNKAVHLFLPPPLRQKEKKVLVTGSAQSSGKLLQEGLEQVLYETVRANPAIFTAEKLVRKWGPDARGVLTALLTEGLLAEQSLFKPIINERTMVQVQLTAQAPDWKTVASAAPRQAEILRMIQEGARTVEEIRTKSSASSSVLKTLEKKGWLTLEEAVVRRSPLTGLLESNRVAVLNEAQTTAAAKICSALRNKDRKTWLLFGVTGSGKTEVYLQAMKEALAQGRQILYLVPEISLTPQLFSILLDHFGSGVALLHSALSAGERFDEWRRIHDKEAMIVLGARSAVFAPFTDLGLIIIDEEHENTYKQNEPDPRYDARRVAEEAADIFGSVIIRGSATPALESWQKAKTGAYELLRLPQRVAGRPLPQIQIIDMKKELQAGNHGLFSQYLREALEKTFRAGEQAILFINRRGFHTFLICRECGHILTCPHCSITLTYHRANDSLLCHYCNYRRKAYTQCPSCGSRFLRYTGTGTERVAEELTKNYPGIRFTRLDADTTQKKGSHFQLLKEFEKGKSQVLIGTQMIAKGLDFPNVTLAGIMNGDNLVNMPDYQSAARAFQLITQVAGRAGRGELPGEVVVQTYSPEHYVYTTVKRQDYETFISQEMENRRLVKYPPFTYLIRILVSGIDEKKVLDRIEYLEKIFKIEIEKDKKTETELFGPAPAPIHCIKGRYRYHLLLRGEDLPRLQAIAAQARSLPGKAGTEPRVIIDVEPQNLL